MKSPSPWTHQGAGHPRYVPSSPTHENGADETARLAAFIGPGGARYAQVAGARRLNWAAFLAGPIWLAHRKLYGLLGLWLAGFWIWFCVIRGAGALIDTASIGGLAAYWVGFARSADGTYKDIAWRRLRELSACPAPATLARLGGTARVWLAGVGVLAALVLALLAAVPILEATRATCGRLARDSAVMEIRHRLQVTPAQQFSVHLGDLRERATQCLGTLTIGAQRAEIAFAPQTKAPQFGERLGPIRLVDGPAEWRRPLAPAAFDPRPHQTGRRMATLLITFLGCAAIWLLLEAYCRAPGAAMSRIDPLAAGAIAATAAIAVFPLALITALWPGAASSLGTAFLGAGAAEEGAKILALWFVLVRMDADLGRSWTRAQWIVVTASLGLGFAFVENVAYAASVVAREDWLGVAWARAMAPVLMHVACGMIIGAVIALGTDRRSAWIAAWAGAVLAHGSYDFWILALDGSEPPFGIATITGKHLDAAAAITLLALATIALTVAARTRLAEEADWSEVPRFALILLGVIGTTLASAEMLSLPLVSFLVPAHGFGRKLAVLGPTLIGITAFALAWTRRSEERGAGPKRPPRRGRL